MDDLDRLSAELHRRVDVLIEALRAATEAEASHQSAKLAQADETAWQARIALAELAIGDAVRERMAREIAPLDNHGDNPETNHRRGLMMLGRFLIDMQPFGRADVVSVAAGDTLRQLNGAEGQLSRPATTGPGRRAFDEIDLNLMRRCVLRVYVECARQDAGVELFLKLSPRAPSYKAFRDWAQRVPAEERAIATEIGQALHAGQPLSGDQAALWAEIGDRGLDEMFGYVLKLKP